MTNKALSDQVQQFLIAMIDKAEQAGSFLEGQLPSYVVELLMWHTTRSVVIVVLSVVIVVLTAIYWVVMVKNWKRLCDSYMETPVMALGVFLGVTSAIAIFAAMKHVLVIIQIQVAPKVWLVDHIRGML